MTKIDQNKTCLHTNNVKMYNNEYKTVCVKNRTCYYFHNMINFEDLDSDNILIDAKSHKKYFHL